MTLLLLLAALIPSPSRAAEWKRVNDHTLEVAGNLGVNEVANIRPLWTDAVNTIVVAHSGNGELDLSVGKFLEGKKYTLVVKGFCGAKCVENVVLPATLLRFDGGCLATGEDANGFLKGIPHDLTSLSGDGAVSAEAKERVEKTVKDWAAYEKRIFAAKHLTPSFYVPKELRRTVTAYFPSMITLMHAGFTVDGDVDMNCVAKSGMRSFYYK